MGAEQYVCWRMQCDKCYAWLKDNRFKYTGLIDFQHEDTMYYQAKQQGWIIDDSYWYCPDCQAERMQP